MNHFKYELHQIIHYMNEPRKIIGRLVHQPNKTLVGDKYYLIVIGTASLLPRDIDMWFDTDSYVELEFVADIDLYFGKGITFAHESECKF